MSPAQLAAMADTLRDEADKLERVARQARRERARDTEQLASLLFLLLGALSRTVEAAAKEQP